MKVTVARADPGAMTRPASLEDAIEEALLHARKRDYENALLCLAFAFAQAARHREQARAARPSSSRAGGRARRPRQPAVPTPPT